MKLIEAMERRQLLTAADVTLADTLVKNITAANNAYTYPDQATPTVSIAGTNGATAYNNSSDCSTFIELLLEQAYSITPTQMSGWAGNVSNPQASDLYTAAKDDDGFTGFMQIGDVVPGDLMFIKYVPTDTDTGHCVMFDQAPTLESETSTQREYEAVIIDCTTDVHSYDTRYETGPKNTNEQGVGRGTMRLYTDQYGNLTNYSWGLSNASVIEGPTDPSNVGSDRFPIFAKAPVSSAYTGNTWLSAGSQATWTLSNTSGNTLTVTGAAAIVADTGADAPNIVLSGSAAQLLFMPGLVSTMHVNSLKLTGGATATVFDPSSGSIVLDIAANVTGTSPGPGIVSVDATSTLDLQHNDMLIHNGSIYLSTITAAVKSGFNGNGNWTGTGITSSSAAADTTHLAALGVIQNTTGSAALYSTFDKLSSAVNDVLVKYTYFGDTNLDGKVDGSDYSKIDSGVLHPTTSTGWANGDLNYDNVINGSDYTLMDNAFNTQGSPVVFSPSAIIASAIPAVPFKKAATVPATPASFTDSDAEALKKNKGIKPLFLSLDL